MKNEDNAIEKLNWYSKGARLKFNYTGDIGKSYELAVLEYSFSFWQWGRSCDSIPTNKKLDDYLVELLKISNISSFSDIGIDQFTSHYYQATQTGYYGYNIEPLKYIKHFTANPSAIFPPKAAKPNLFSSELYQSFQKWLDENGNNILYIYGGIDTWSAPRVLVSDRVNSKSFLIPGASHGTARIKNLPDKMKAEFAGKIKEWTGSNCNLDILKSK